MRNKQTINLAAYRDPDLPCPKCGVEDSTVQYAAPSALLYEILTVDGRRVSDFLLAKCEGCGYTVRMPCKDAVEQKPDAELAQNLAQGQKDE